MTEDRLAVAGQVIAVTLNSADFNPYLSLLDSEGAVLIDDDDGGDGTNSRIPAASGFFNLPATGTYIIEVSSSQTNRTGNYSLTVNLAPGCVNTLAPGSSFFAAWSVWRTTGTP